MDWEKRRPLPGGWGKASLTNPTSSLFCDLCVLLRLNSYRNSDPMTRPSHFDDTRRDLRKIRLSNTGHGLVLNAAFRNHFTDALAAG